MNWCGIDAALRLVDELEAGAALAAARRAATPRRTGRRRRSASCGDGSPRPSPVIVSRYGMRGGRVSTSSLNWLAIRSSTERRCRSPSARSTVSFVVASCSTTSVGILGDHPVQHFGNPLLVAALLRRDGDALHRRREFERPHVDVILVVRVVQHAVEFDLVDLRDRGDVARAPRARSRRSCRPAA